AAVAMEAVRLGLRIAVEQQPARIVADLVLDERRASAGGDDRDRDRAAEPDRGALHTAVLVVAATLAPLSTVAVFLSADSVILKCCSGDGAGPPVFTPFTS